MANQPALIPSAWAENNSTKLTIPATTSETGKASWDQGFPIETSLPLTYGGIPPKYGDFNGILNILSQFALFAQSGGKYAWTNQIDYSVGSIVLGTDGYIYRAAQVSGPSTTAVNPVGDTSGKWEKIVSQSDLTAISSQASSAMSVASAADVAAGAATSAVTTLDANVVKLTGNQTVGGQKSYTASAVFSSGATIKGGMIVSGGATISGGITGSCTSAGSAGTITSTLPISKGGTGQTTRLDAFKAINSASVTSPDYFIGFTSSWASGGYVTIANTKTALGITAAGISSTLGTSAIASSTKATTAASCTGNAATATSATNAGTATKVGTATVGSAGRPTYISAGTPTACNFSVRTGSLTISSGGSPITFSPVFTSASTIRVMAQWTASSAPTNTVYIPCVDSGSITTSGATLYPMSISGSTVKQATNMLIRWVAVGV